METVKSLLGIRPVDIGELNRRATREVEKQKQKTNDKTQPDEIVITEEYKTILEILESDYPEADCPVIFVTGNAGTGKSTLISYLRNVLDKRLVVVAPTGVAALNAGGVTIHSFFHFPPKILDETDIKLVYDRKLYQKLELLIIDEVSMVRCDLLDGIDRFLKKNRSSNEPFGGVRLLLIGDLFQLPPVVNQPEWDVLRARGYDSPYFFSSFCLQEASLLPIELTTVYRQEDQSFVDLLNRIRIGEDLDFVINEVNRRCFRQDDFQTDITLTSTNDQADQINMRELGRLPSREYSFEGRIERKFSIEQDKLPSPLLLKLKVGARVMFTKNDEQRRWVNGTIGIVRELDQETIRVEIAGNSYGMVYDVLPATWETYKYSYDPERDQIIAEKVGQYTQYPLMLGWAVTIHKSQGKSLDNIFVDIGPRAFASGQVYVALSRCRSIEGIRLKRPLRVADIICDPVIKRFYFNLEEMGKEKENGPPPLPEKG